jgi:Fur family transcriptional regulator, stress-responsive regulator
MPPRPNSTVDGHEDLISRLRSRGQRVTPQRLVIHRVLRERDGHVTADEVHEAVAHDLPGTSKPTVYATLDLLAELGLVRRVQAGSGATLYDSRKDDHHHMVCLHCGKVEDLDVWSDPAPVREAAERSGFHPEQVDVIVAGLCDSCARSAA